MCTFLLFFLEMAYRDKNTSWNLGSVSPITDNISYKSQQWMGSPNLPLNLTAAGKQVTASSNSFGVISTCKVRWFSTKLKSLNERTKGINRIWDGVFNESSCFSSLSLGGCFHQCALKCAIWTRASSITSQWTSCLWTPNATGVCSKLI